MVVIPNLWVANLKGTWFEPYVVHVDSSDFEVRMVGSARHNYHKSDWYIRAKESSESFWSDPYFTTTARTSAVIIRRQK